MSSSDNSMLDVPTSSASSAGQFNQVANLSGVIRQMAHEFVMRDTDLACDLAFNLVSGYADKVANMAPITPEINLELRSLQLLASDLAMAFGDARPHQRHEAILLAGHLSRLVRMRSRNPHCQELYMGLGS